MKSIKFSLLGSLLLAAACGGGSSGGGSNNTKIIEGLLTQGQAVVHSEARIKHGENQPLEEVKICALGRCSTTDGQGNYGFSAPEDFQGGDVLFTVDGHGILAETTVNIPSTGTDIFIHLQSSSKSEVRLHHILVDGVAVESTIETGEQLHG